MTVQKKSKATAATPAPAPVAATAPKQQEQSQDELEEIMNEIEQLQEAMAEAPKAQTPAAPAPALKVVPPPAAPTPQADAAPADSPTTDATETNILDEFRVGGGSEVSMEDTLVDLKEESTGPTLIDQAIEAEQQNQDSEVTEVSAEAEAVAEAQAEAEVAAALSGAEAECQDSEQESEVDSENTEGEVMPKQVTGADGTLTMTLQGNMTLKLKYDYEGQEVTVSFVDQALCVQLSDGTEFKIPVRKKQPLRRVG